MLSVGKIVKAVNKDKNTYVITNEYGHTFELKKHDSIFYMIKNIPFIKFAVFDYMDVDSLSFYFRTEDGFVSGSVIEMIASTDVKYIHEGHRRGLVHGIGNEIKFEMGPSSLNISHEDNKITLNKMDHVTVFEIKDDCEVDIYHDAFTMGGIDFREYNSGRKDYIPVFDAKNIFVNGSSVFAILN